MRDRAHRHFDCVSDQLAGDRCEAAAALHNKIGTFYACRAHCRDCLACHRLILLPCQHQ
jgi:hypothetical protein